MKTIKLILFIFAFFLFTSALRAQFIWTELNSGSSTQLSGIYFTSSDTGYVTNDDGNILKTTNAGNNWVTIQTGYSFEPVRIFFPSQNTGYFTSWNGDVVKTTDAGLNWVSVNVTSSHTYGIFFTDDNTGYVTVTNGNLFKTTNGGTNWTAVLQQSEELLSVFFLNSNTGYVTGDHLIFKTTNGGNSWSASGTLQIYGLGSIYFTNANTGYAAGNNTGGDSWVILKTTDAGSNWNIMQTGTGGELWGITFKNDTVGTAVGYSGDILVTTNSGVNWTKANSPTSNNLYTVVFTGTGDGYISGAGGKILKYTSPPLPPTLVLPSNGSTDVTVTPLFDWSDIPGAQKYRIQVSAFNDFSILWIDDSSSAVSQYQSQPGVLAYNSGYFWRVSAKNSAGWGNFQSPFVFYTSITPPFIAPNLISPSNGASGVIVTPTLDWSDVWSAVKYKVQVSFDSAFAVKAIDDSSSTSSQFTVPWGKLTHDTLYYWRAAAWNGSTWTSFSSIWSFRTDGILSPPVLLSPGNFDTGIVVTPQIDWSDDPSATKYRLQVSAFLNFSVLWIDEYTTVSNYQVPPGVLAYNSRYFWRVKSLDAADSSNYSDSFNFFTKIFPGSSRKPITLNQKKIFDLSSVSGYKTKKFTIQICKDTLFSVLFLSIDSSGVNSIEIPLDKFDNYSTYFWRVKIPGVKHKNYISPIKVFVTEFVKEDNNPGKSGPGLPVSFNLYQNFPNPFNPVSKIRFDIAKTTNVKIVIYDVLGREMGLLFNGKLEPGVYESVFDGSKYASGIYFYKLETNFFTDTKKMVIVK